MLNNNNIKVAMLEISPQNKAILEFYFDRAGKGLYNVVHEDAADALIIDYDQFGAKEHVAEIHAKRDIPILLISIREQDIPSTVWVAKPLSADALNKAAVTVKAMAIEIASAAEAEAEKAIEVTEEVEAVIEIEEVAETELVVEDETVAELDVDEFDVLNEEHLEEEELSLDGSIKELNAVDEKAITENLLEIDEMVLDESISEQKTTEKVTAEESRVEENKAEQNDLVDSGLAIAGIGASALVTSSLISGDDDHNDELFELDDISNDVTENTSSGLDKDLDENISEALNEDLSVDLDEEDDVDSLLDSLISEEDDKEILTEDNIETTDVEVDEEDAFLDNLLLDPDLEESKDTTLEKDLEVDVLQSVDSELEGNFDLQKSLKAETNNKLVIEDEKAGLIDEDFTLHDDIDSSSEDVYAETLEVNYAEVKSDDKGELPESIEPLSEESGELSLDIEDFSADSITETSEELMPDLGETLDSDFSFDFDATKTEDSASNVDVEATQTNIEAAPKSVDDFELTLLDESDQEEEKPETEAISLEDDLDMDLDSLLEEISEEGSDKNSDDGSDDDSDNSIQENNNILSKLESDIQALAELEPETVVAGGIAAAGVATVLDDANIDDGISKSDSGNDLSDDDLQSLLNEVREEASSSLTAGTGAADDNAYEKTEAEKRWMQLCGNEQTIKNQKEAAKIGFDVKKHLLGVILDQIKTTKEKEQLFRLKYKDLIIVIDHSQSKVYCNTHITSDEFSVFCSNEIEHKEVKIHDLDYSEERLYRSKIEKNPRRAHSFESFIWVTSLLTSRGRLPEGTNVTKPVGLKTWPNLTRLEAIPHAMNMAAVFAKHPGTLLEIPNWLNIQQKYVFAFYNAALALDMIELDSNKLKKSGFKFGNKAVGKKSEERGFFGRLLKRLKT